MKILTQIYFVVIVAAAFPVLAQNPPANPPTTTTDPTGKACASNSVQNYIPSGQLFTCQNGVLTKIKAGGSPPTGAAGGVLSGTYPNPGIVFTLNIQTASYGVQQSDFTACKTIRVSSTSATTVTLLASAPATGQCVFVSNVNSGIVSVSPNGLTINAQSQSWPVGQYQSIMVVSDGSNYFTSGGAVGAVTNFYAPQVVVGVSAPPFSATAIYAAPVHIPSTIVGATKIGIDVTGGAAGTYDVGLYYLYPGFVPGTSTLPLLCSLGGVALGSTAFREISTAATCNLPAGTYMFAYAGSGTATIAFGGLGIDPFVNTTTTTTSGGVLPATITLNATGVQATVLVNPLFYLR